MAEVIRTVVGSVDIEPERPTREPVVMRGIPEPVPLYRAART